MYYDIDINIYMKGLNISYANGLYIIGNYFCDREIFDQFIENFQTLFRMKTPKSINDFYESADRILAIKNEMVKDIFSCISASRNKIVELVSNYDKYILDFSVSIFIIHCSWWGKGLGEKFSIRHDNSKQIDHWRDHIKSMSDDRIPVTEVGYDYRKSTYPLMINDLEFVDSKSHKQVQLADLISSAISYCLKVRHVDKNENDAFANGIFASKLSQIDSWPIMPSTKITPEELGTTNSAGIDAVNFSTLIGSKYFER